MARVPTIVVLIVACLAAPAGRALGQGRALNALGRQDLTFGVLLPGVRATVSRLDAANAGQFEVRGQKSAEVRITLTLPSEMVSALGARLPLEFGPGDGGVSDSPVIATSTAFDPRVPVLRRLAANGKLYVFLGGSAVPRPDQPGGAYAGTIALTVTYTGN